MRKVTQGDKTSRTKTEPKPKPTRTSTGRAGVANVVAPPEPRRPAAPDPAPRPAGRRIGKSKTEETSGDSLIDRKLTRLQRELDEARERERKLLARVRELEADLKASENRASLDLRAVKSERDRLAAALRAAEERERRHALQERNQEWEQQREKSKRLIEQGEAREKTLEARAKRVAERNQKQAAALEPLVDIATSLPEGAVRREDAERVRREVAAKTDGGRTRRTETSRSPKTGRRFPRS